MSVLHHESILEDCMEQAITEFCEANKLTPEMFALIEDHLGVQYALDRKQFGKALIEFPRVASKLAMMAVETTIARQLTYYSAFEKDNDRRCDLEAGMAKLLGARVAWAAADNGLQIHGGNGFALEYQISRVLCDARILNIFEGAAEIQAQVITRRLME